MQTEFSILRELDEAFWTIASNLHQHSNKIIESLLFLRTHSVYRATCRLVMSGQISESFALMRSALENALYAHYIFAKSAAGEIWIRRHDDANSLKKCKEEFTYGHVRDCLNNADGALGATCASLYERTIEFGSHPNERSVTMNLNIKKDAERIELTQNYLAGGIDKLAPAMKTCAQIGLGCLLIFQRIFPERFNILQVTPTLDRLRQGL